MVMTSLKILISSMQKAHILVGFFYFAIVLLTNIGYNVSID